MKKNNLKLSVLSTAILLSLAGCGGSDSKPKQVEIVDVVTASAF
ncbi:MULTISPECIES: hypothetical protein [unclassified Pseudoalteromonas]|nr:MULTISPECIES: hypothetical protein [unclassified Pseudoalteromonas]